MHKETAVRRPDVIIEVKKEKKIYSIDMACSNEGNAVVIHQEKLEKISFSWLSRSETKENRDLC